MSWALGIAFVVGVFFVARWRLRLAASRRDVARWAEERAKRREQPAIEDALGTFTCDGSSWTASVTRGEDTVRISRLGDAPEDLHAALARDRDLVARVLADDAPYRLDAAKVVVATYNQSWRERGPEIDAETLAKDLTLRTIKISSDDYFSYLLFYCPRQYFAGHRVELVLAADHEPRLDLGGITDER